MLNKYQWKNYLLSGGDKIVTVFQDFLNCKNLNNFTSTIKKLVNNFCPDELRGIELEEEINECIINPLVKNELDSLFEPDKKYTVKSTLDFIRREYKKILREEKRKSSDNNVLELFLCNIDWLTTQFALEIPDLFVPYYFQRNFNVFSNIVDMFNIKLDLNCIPLKSDYKGRFYYYGEICNALQNFKVENNLNVAELWAFLYDYAPKCAGGLDYIKKDLSEPQNAFFIGGTSTDMFGTSGLDVVGRGNNAWNAYVAALNILNTNVLFSKSRLLLSKLFEPGADSNRKSLEKHHLFPKAYLKGLGYTDGKINRMANYAFIDWKDNMEILDKSPDVYYPIICKNRNPEDIIKMEEENALPHGWENMSYEEFLTERCKLMSAKIKQAVEVLKNNI